MALFVNTNLSSLNAQRHLEETGSSLSTSLGLFAVFLATNGHPALYPTLAWVTRHAGRALWGLAVGAGFMSDRRLPRLLAWSVVLEAVVFYSWDRFGWTGGFYPWNMWIHIGLGLLLAAPAALAWARRRSGPDAP